ncbi:MAG TPA: hypothetical protein VD963_00940 [Phycisphaerales bacterium]|nr:hypothetical protein [Phycisphaerales bacterium]
MLLRCVIVDACGAVTTSPTAISTHAPLEVLAHPGAVVTCPSGIAEFVLGLGGTAVVSWEWRAPALSPGWVPAYHGINPDWLEWRPLFEAEMNPQETLSIQRLPGGPVPLEQWDGFEVRAVAYGSCGTETSAPAALTVCPADFNCNGQVGTSAISAFLVAWFHDLTGGTLNADFTPRAPSRPPT